MNGKQKNEKIGIYEARANVIPAELREDQLKQNKAYLDQLTPQLEKAHNDLGKANAAFEIAKAKFQTLSLKQVKEIKAARNSCNQAELIKQTLVSG